MNIVIKYKKNFKDGFIFKAMEKILNFTFVCFFLLSIPVTYEAYKASVNQDYFIVNVKMYTHKYASCLDSKKEIYIKDSVSEVDILANHLMNSCHYEIDAIKGLYVATSGPFVSYFFSSDDNQLFKAAKQRILETRIKKKIKK